MILVTYTTSWDDALTYRRAARALTSQRQGDGCAVRCTSVETKRDLVGTIRAVEQSGETIDAWHVFGPVELYGPMFGTPEFPEQFSKHEWGQLDIPFAPSGEIYLHGPGTARWCAPFLAHAFDVSTVGYRRSTSDAKGGRLWPGGRPADQSEPWPEASSPNGEARRLANVAASHLDVLAVRKARRFSPDMYDPDAGSYDDVAELYDSAFDGIRVRIDEWRWLEEHLPDRGVDGERPPKVLDVGCGHGALLERLDEHVERGRGVDVSSNMIRLARERTDSNDTLTFDTVDGPHVPVEDDTFDVVVSFLSFRYLDWAPILNEVDRVLREGGRLLIADLVAEPLSPAELPAFVASKWRTWRAKQQHPAFDGALDSLVESEGWDEMLRHHPVRRREVVERYLESRCPESELDTLNVGWDKRILAFDSGPLYEGDLRHPSYPI